MDIRKAWEEFERKQRQRNLAKLVKYKKDQKLTVRELLDKYFGKRKI